MTEEEEEFYSLREINMNHPFDEKFSSKRGLGYVCLLTLIVLLFYWEGLGAYFNGIDMDDLLFAVNHAQGWYLHHEVWRPIYYALNHLMYVSFGLNPLPYHLLSLILYVSILPLLYYFYNLLQDNRALSKVAVLLFASFYLHAEVVTTITYQKELLWALFAIATLIYFCRYRKTNSLRCYALAIFFGILAALSKEAFVGLPLLLLAVDHRIFYDTFPPNLPPLKDLRQCLLPHLPFWLMALALFIFILAIPQDTQLPHLARTNTLFRLLDHVYWLGIYSISPCFITDRLTIILTFSITVGLGWLFYHSHPQRRSFIVTMTACTSLSLLPYVLVGPIPRYFFLSSIFSILLVTLLAFEIGSSVHQFLEARPGYRFYLDSSITSWTLLILLPIIYLNYQDVRQYTKNSAYAGRLLREIVEGTARILPQGPGESAIIYLNLPSTVQSKAVLSLDHYVAFNNMHTAALKLYCSQPGIPNYYRDPRLAYIALGYDIVRLSPKAWYNLVKTPAFTTTLSDREFNALSMEGKNKILFFNPVTNKLVDVSGWSYEELDRSIAPYRDRDKLSHAPPVEQPNSFADTSI